MAASDRTYQEVGKILQEARTQAGLTQREFAQRLKRAHTVVAKVELGERRLDVLELIEFARGLRLDPRELFARIVEAQR